MGCGAAMRTAYSYGFLLLLRYYCFLCTDVPLSWAFSVGYSKKKTPKRGIGAGASPVHADSLSVGSPLFTAGEGRAEPCSRDGCCRVGWSEQVPSTEFLAETTACLVTPLFLQIRIVCTLINKSCLSLAGWQVSTMEIISVRENVSLCKTSLN